MKVNIKDKDWIDSILKYLQKTRPVKYLLGKFFFWFLNLIYKSYRLWCVDHPSINPLQHPAGQRKLDKLETAYCFLCEINKELTMSLPLGLIIALEKFEKMKLDGEISSDSLSSSFDKNYWKNF